MLGAFDQLVTVIWCLGLIILTFWYQRRRGVSAFEREL
jgi:hypothetical protein